MPIVKEGLEISRLLKEESIKPLREQIFGSGIEINKQIQIFLELCLIAQDLMSIKAAFRWIEDPCPDHDRYLLHQELQIRYTHRRDCPKCLEIIKGVLDEKEIS